jgi:hypothetical protein
MVIERFTLQSTDKFTANKNFKSIVRKQSLKRMTNPHYAKLRNGRYINTLKEDIQMVDGMYGVAETPVWDHLRVNHYVTKSLEEFVLGKALKGSAATKGRVKHKDYFFNHDRNEESWEYSEILIEKVKETLNTLESLMTKLDVEQHKSSWFEKSKLSKTEKREKNYLERSGKFDIVWYLMAYPDVANSGMDPIEHFVRFGAYENRNPNEFFDVKFYVTRYKDVAKSSINPFIHYLKFGQDEGRLGLPSDSTS